MYSSYMCMLLRTSKYWLSLNIVATIDSMRFSKESDITFHDPYLELKRSVTHPLVVHESRGSSFQVFRYRLVHGNSSTSLHVLLARYVMLSSSLRERDRD
jgi:hypothetical protein